MKYNLLLTKYGDVYSIKKILSNEELEIYKEQNLDIGQKRDLSNLCHTILNELLGKKKWEIKVRK